MNERIQKLADQAGPTTIGEINTNLGSIHVINIEKFAELMVKKFDDILVLEYLDCVGNQDKQAAKRIERLRERVKTYFGVEE